MYIYIYKCIYIYIYVYAFTRVNIYIEVLFYVNASKNRQRSTVPGGSDLHLPLLKHRLPHILQPPALGLSLRRVLWGWREKTKVIPI